MKRLRHFFIVLGISLIFSAPSQGLAAGIINVSGRLTSITDSQYVVETAKSIYYIKRKAVSPAEAAKLVKTEVPVAIAVPLDGIDRVKAKEEPNK